MPVVGGEDKICYHCTVEVYLYTSIYTLKRKTAKRTAAISSNRTYTPCTWGSHTLLTPYFKRKITLPDRIIDLPPAADMIPSQALVLHSMHTTTQPQYRAHCTHQRVDNLATLIEHGCRRRLQNARQVRASSLGRQRQRPSCGL